MMITSDSIFNKYIFYQCTSGRLFILEGATPLDAWSNVYTLYTPENTGVFLLLSSSYTIGLFTRLNEDLIYAQISNKHTSPDKKAYYIP